jgi:hypothetical protein
MLWKNLLSKRRSSLVPALLVTLAVSTLPRSGKASMVDVTAPTTSWTAVSYGNNYPDPSNDQQTGSEEGDIVGNALHPSAYTMYGDAGTGTLAFRVRVGADASPAGFKTALFVGIDANNDGTLDLFVGVNNSGSADQVAIWSPGAGLNISPSTTTIVSTPLVSYTPTAGANYSWAAVNTTIDPTVGTATDLDGGGQNDYFLSFSVPFNDIVTKLNAKGITGITPDSAFSYVIATATQANSLNQDLDGVGKTYDASAIWSVLGVVTDSAAPSGVAVVPEMDALFPVIAILSAVIAHWHVRRRRRSKSCSHKVVWHDRARPF